MQTAALPLENHRAEWSMEEDKFLVKFYPTTPIADLVDMFGRSQGAITARASELGVVKNRVKYKRICQLLNEGMNVNEIAEELDLSYNYVRRRVVAEYGRVAIERCSTIEGAFGKWPAFNDL